MTERKGGYTALQIETLASMPGINSTEIVDELYREPSEEFVTIHPHKRRVSATTDRRTNSADAFKNPA